MFTKGPIIFVLATLFSLFIVAWGAAAPPTQAPAPTVKPLETESPQATGGQQLFISKGCAACHGQDGEGTNFAPALAGHTQDQTKRQVRAPVGLMPVFPPDKISKEELEEIAEYVASLGGGHGHAQTMNVGDAVAQHHWMALFALEQEDQQEATHHLNHLMELVSGDHAARMQEALKETEAGRYHDGAHVVEEMLAGIDPLELTQRDMHLRLAISAARVEEAPEAIHQMEHYLELVDESSSEAASLGPGNSGFAPGWRTGTGGT